MPEPEFGPKTTTDEVIAAWGDRMRGKNVIITGVSPNSIGLEVVRVLAPLANLIVILGRNEARLNEAKALVMAEVPNANIRPVIADLGSLASVRAGAQTVLDFPETFQILFNNAACHNPSTLHRTSDGFELNFGVGHVGHFLLTNLILPKLQPSAASGGAPRVVTTSSRVHQMGDVRWDDPNFVARPEEYNTLISYSQLKSANLIFARALARRWGARGGSFAVHPGTVLTGLFDETLKGFFIKQGWMDPAGNPVDTPAVVWKSVNEAAAGYLRAAFDPELEAQPGSYVLDCQIRNDLIAPHAKDEANEGKLWTLSEELVKQQFLAE